MNSDGTRDGYDIKQLAIAKKTVSVPVIASGGAGSMDHFSNVFESTNVDGALAASVFHKDIFSVSELKDFLLQEKISVRPV